MNFFSITVLAVNSDLLTNLPALELGPFSAPPHDAGGASSIQGHSLQLLFESHPLWLSGTIFHTLSTLTFSLYWFCPITLSMLKWNPCCHPNFFHCITKIFEINCLCSLYLLPIVICLHLHLHWTAQYYQWLHCCFFFIFILPDLSVTFDFVELFLLKNLLVITWSPLFLSVDTGVFFACPPFFSLEKAMAPHSSTLAWKIPQTEEPSRLQSMGSLRVRHDWVTSLSLFTFLHWRRKWQPTRVFLPGESQGWGNLVGCCLWGRTESDTTDVT